jgi:hypothetical protein
MKITFEGGTPFLNASDVLETEDEIRRGDFVWFEHIAQGRIVMRLLDEIELNKGDHSVWQIDRGDAPEELKIALIIKGTQG